MDNETRRAILREIRNSPIEPKHPEYPQTVNIPSATYAPWLSDREFSTLYEQIKQNTLVDVYRCYELWSLAVRCAELPGDTLEVGTWRGGTGALLAAAIAARKPDKTVFLCDTFRGVVKAGSNDTAYRGGEHSDTSEETVRSLLAKLAIRNIRLLHGIFPEETGHSVAERLFALGHIDVDVYSSAKDVFDWVAPRLVTQGIVVFDDYGFLGCEGVTKLVHELATRPDFFTFYNLNGHAVMLKLT